MCQNATTVKKISSSAPTPFSEICWLLLVENWVSTTDLSNHRKTDENITLLFQGQYWLFGFVLFIIVSRITTIFWENNQVSANRNLKPLVTSIQFCEGLKSKVFYMHSSILPPVVFWHVLTCRLPGCNPQCGYTMEAYAIGHRHSNFDIDSSSRSLIRILPRTFFLRFPKNVLLRFSNRASRPTVSIVAWFEFLNVV